MERRTYLGTVVTGLVSLGDWIPGFNTEDEPAEQIQEYPLEHGSDVDTPTAAHHTPPSAGAFLAEVDDAFDVHVQQESDSWTLAAASNGTHTFSMATDYDLAFSNTFLDVTGGVLSEVSARTSGWVTKDDGTISGVEVVWTNSSTSDQPAIIEVLGFQK